MARGPKWLTAEDFEVLDEGVPVEIADFAPPSPLPVRPPIRGLEMKPPAASPRTSKTSQLFSGWPMPFSR